MQQMNQSSVEVSDCAGQLLDGSRHQVVLLKEMAGNMDAITASIEQGQCQPDGGMYAAGRDKDIARQQLYAEYA